MNRTLLLRCSGGWRRDERGAAAVELALLLPFILLLMFGLFEMGRLFWTYHIASGAVRNGARYAARLDLDCSNLPTNPDWGSVRNYTRTGTPSGSTPLIAGWANSDIVVTTSCVANTFTDAQGGTVVLSGRYQGKASLPKIRVQAIAHFSTLFGALIPLDLTQFTVAHEEPWTG